MGILERWLMPGLYERLVLPAPKSSVLPILTEIDEFTPSSGKSLFHQVLPKYHHVADDIEKSGYKGIAELIRFTFNQTSEYFTRQITTKDDDESLESNVGEQLDASARGLGYALKARSKPDSLRYINSMYQAMVPKGSDQETKESRELIAHAIEQSASAVRGRDTRPIRRTLSSFAGQTLQDQDLTFAINYLHTAFNTHLKELGEGPEAEALAGHLERLAKGIQRKNELDIYFSLDTIATLAYDLRNK